MKIEVYTDGACSGNPGPGGWAAQIYIDDSLIQTFTGRNPHTTNNVMELTGPIEALDWIVSNPEYLDQQVTIFSDSNYVVKAMTEWVHGWIQTDFKGKKNVDLMKHLYSLTYESSLEVTYSWVRGHSGDPRNDSVDKLAVAARMGR